MTIGKLRSALYWAAKFLGDVNAAKRAAQTGSAQPIVKRIARRQAGRLTAILLGKLFR